MTKSEFISQLSRGLSAKGLPEADIQKTLDYYSELIDDCIEDGKPEEEAVSEMGNIDEIISQILIDMPLHKVVKASVSAAKSKRGGKSLSPLIIALIAIGSPVWLPIVLALAAILLSIYISIWAVVLSFYITSLALGASALYCIVSGVMYAAIEHEGTLAIMLSGAALVTAGISILIFMLSNRTAFGSVRIVSASVRGIKNIFIRRGEHEKTY